MPSYTKTRTRRDRGGDEIYLDRDDTYYIHERYYVIILYLSRDSMSMTWLMKFLLHTESRLQSPDVPSLLERLARKTNYIVRSCSLSSAHLYEGHVDLINVRSLFSVHFDAHKVFAEQCANLLALKRLLLHHVTPVAGRVANGQEYRLALRLGFVKRLFTPRVPSIRTKLLYYYTRSCIYRHPLTSQLGWSHALAGMAISLEPICLAFCLLYSCPRPFLSTTLA